MSFYRSKVIRRAQLRLLGAFVASYLFAGGAVWLYLHRDAVSWYIYAAVAAHIFSGLSFILFTAAKPRALPGTGFYYPRIAALFTLFMPLIGLFGVTMTLLAARVFMKSHGLAEEYKEKAYEGGGIDIDLPSDISEFLYEEVDVHPIADILTGTDMEMKRGAVNLLRRIGSAEAVKLLRKSLSDESAEVRFYAHTALTRLEEDYAQALDKARFRAEKYDSAQAHAELASTYRNYARSGLPEVNMQERSMVLACDHWRLAVQKDQENKDYLMRLAESYVDSKNFSDALSIYRKSMNDSELELESRLGSCRVFFEVGNFIALFQEVEQMRARPELDSTDPFKGGIYKFWMDEPTVGDKSLMENFAKVGHEI
ncbi:HEAT repeat domain-containing protein [Maridesulfovibrio sp.]|uniref:HEAT repeat domain-containing protein n=1 Tax=Maridesulfovibrio sp. TaxID=2795000 RepID=UPI002AA723AC|nr:HEAT repeat domain-containing protein [Maridesulfovibrio sp.]